MARMKKQPTGDVPPPKDPSTVKHGCCSCTHYKLDVKACPCRDCEKWNYWEDSSPEQAPPFVHTSTGQLSLVSD